MPGKGKPFSPGDPRAGRPKGTPNKATRDVRTVFSAFVEANAEKAQAPFDRVAARDPAKALDPLARLAEFVIPTLARTDLTGDAAVKDTPVIRVTFAEPRSSAASDAPVPP
jgi:hypothetical protein